MRADTLAEGPRGAPPRLSFDVGMLLLDQYRIEIIGRS